MPMPSTHVRTRVHTHVSIHMSTHMSMQGDHFPLANARVAAKRIKSGAITFFYRSMPTAKAEELRQIHGAASRRASPTTHLKAPSGSAQAVGDWRRRAPRKKKDPTGP